MLGLGTMLLPFAAAYFAHVPSATLAFAAFALLLRERERSSSWLLVAAGALAGLAVFVELPLAVVALCVGAFAAVAAAPGAPRRAVRRGSGRRLAAALRLQRLGVRLALPERLLQRGPGARVDRARRHRRQRHRLLRLDPSPPRRALRLARFRTRPVRADARHPRRRRGTAPPVASRRREEAFLVGGVAAAVLLYNAAYYLPFGGGSPGPRFLVPVLPFLALPLAAMLLRWPLVVRRSSPSRPSG